MREERYHIALDKYDKNIVINALNTLRTRQLQEERPTDPVDELIIKVTMCEDSIKTVLIFLLAYAMGIGVYFSTRRNYRRREEHGSAKWGNAGALNKKYRDKDPSANKLLTQNVRIGLDGKKHRRNLNILVCGGSGAGKTRFFCKPNAMQCNTSFVILDPNGERRIR